MSNIENTTNVEIGLVDEKLTAAQKKVAKQKSEQAKKLAEFGLKVADKPQTQELTLAQQRKLTRTALEAVELSPSKAFNGLRKMFTDKETKSVAVDYLRTLINKGDEVVKLVNGKVEFDPSVKGLNTLFVKVIASGLGLKQICQKADPKNKRTKWTSVQMLTAAYRWSVSEETPKKK